MPERPIARNAPIATSLAIRRVLEQSNERGLQRGSRNRHRIVVHVVCVAFDGSVKLRPIMV
jgi:hypothetical protein